MKKIYTLALLLCAAILPAQLTVTPNSVATSLAQTIAGFGVTVSNASLSCTSNGAGTFTYTGSHLGLTNGVLLTTGDATAAAQPQSSFSGTDNGNNISDPQLVAIEPLATHNLCKLEFDFVPICPSLSIKYVFASEEYPTFVGAGYNDAFGIFLTGPNPSGAAYANSNIAKLPNGQAVSINNVNSSSNSSSFVANYNLNYNDIVYGGYTVPITSSATITPCQSYHIKFAIADAGDGNYDSGVFIQYDGLSCSNSPTITPSSVASACGGNTGSASVNVSGTSPSSYSWQPGGQTTSSISGQAPGTYTCIMTFTAACSSYTQAQVVTIAASGGMGTVAATSNAPCAGSALTLGTSGGTSYSWSGPGGFTSSVQNPTIPSSSSGNSGVYSVTVTSAGCTSTGTVNATVNPLPVVTMPGTQTLTCSSPSVPLAASASPSTSTPVWTGGVCSGANSYTATACTAGTYTLTATNGATGCSGSGTVSVVPGSNVVTGTASNSGSITCTNTSVQVTATSTSSPVSYSWTGPGAVTGSATSTGTVSVGGVYSCVITNTMSGCSTTITTTVPTNTTAPTASVTPSATITCAAPTVTLTGSPASGVTYTWTGPGIVSGANTATPAVNQGGTYTLSVTGAANGCTSATTVSVANTSAVPSLSLSASSLTLTCAATTVSATVTSTTTPLSYSWSPGPASGGSTNNPVFNAPGSYTITATNSSNGCTASAVVTVSSNTTAPAVSITPSQTLTCASPTAAINTTVTPSAGITYSWTTGATTSSVTANQGGTYAVTVTNSANGCTNTASSNVASAAGLPSATLSTTPANDVLTCSHQTVTINAAGSPSGGVSYNWSTGSTASSATTSNAGVVTVTVTNTASGCTITAQYTVTSNTAPPSLTAAGGTITCASPATNISASSTNTNVTYSWTGPGVSSGSNTASPTVNASGNYTVVATNTLTGCTSSSVVSVASQTGINAAFTPNPTGGPAPLNVNFTNQSTGATGYVWTFGDGNGSSSANPSDTYINPGTYVVTLVATSGSCSDTAQVTITVDAPFSIEIPNVFTPNGDSKNDVFYLKSTGVKELSLSIFNRWGEKLYEGSGVDASWNGQSPGGAKVPDGTYFYFVKATGFDGKEVEKHGTVSLYR